MSKTELFTAEEIKNTAKEPPPVDYYIILSCWQNNRWKMYKALYTTYAAAEKHIKELPNGYTTHKIFRIKG